MKVILPVHHFPPHYSAGAELYAFRLARWLLAHGHEVEVVCVEAIDQGRAGELHATEDHYEGITVWRLAFNLIKALSDYAGTTTTRCSVAGSPNILSVRSQIWCIFKPAICSVLRRWWQRTPPACQPC